MKVRSDLIQNVQMKITRLKQELTLLNRQSKIISLNNRCCYSHQLCVAKTQYLPDTEDYQDWVPPDRLHTIDILFIIYLFFCLLFIVLVYYYIFNLLLITLICRRRNK